MKAVRKTHELFPNLMKAGHEYKRSRLFIIQNESNTVSVCVEGMLLWPNGKVEMERKIFNKTYPTKSALCYDMDVSVDLLIHLN